MKYTEVQVGRSFTNTQQQDAQAGESSRFYRCAFFTAQSDEQACWQFVLREKADKHTPCSLDANSKVKCFARSWNKPAER